MPVVAAVKDSEGLGDIEVEEPEGWECPGLVIGAVYEGRDGEDYRSEDLNQHRSRLRGCS